MAERMHIHPIRQRNFDMWQHTPLPPGPSQAVPGLVLQLLAWVGRAERSYDETMDAWRTSCPRLSVWEDVVDAGLVVVDPAGARGFGHARVRLTPQGERVLKGLPPA
jgi:hypothetical protein